MDSQKEVLNEQIYTSGNKITKMKINDKFYYFDLNEELINVEFYGAVANVEQAAVANRTAFQAAINAAANQNKGLFIPNKKFYIDVSGGSLIIQDRENIKIVNCGEIFCSSYERNNVNESTTKALFWFGDCENVIFQVGRLNSIRDQEAQAAPAGEEHHRVPTIPGDNNSQGLSSNITAIQIERCDNLIICDGIITNMEYAIHSPRFTSQSDFNKTIIIDNLNINNTSQPFLINSINNIIIKNCSVDSCALMGTGDHHVYVCDFVNYIRIEDCVFNFVDNYYGSALNFYNSWLGKEESPNSWSVKQAEVINCRVTNARYQRIVTGNGDSEITIDGCDFRYLDTGESFSVDKNNAVNEWNNYYGEGNITADTMEGRRGVFHIGSANSKLSVIVRNTSIVDPINCGQLVSGWVYPWTLNLNNCNIKLGFLASYTITGTGLFNNPSLTLSNCDITVRHWLLILKSFASSNTATPSKVLLLNSKINCPFNTGVTPLVDSATPLISMHIDPLPENKLLSSLKILNCVINGHENNVFSDDLNNSCIVANSIIEGFNNNIFNLDTFEGKCYNNYINGEYCDFKNIINNQSNQENGAADNQSSQEGNTTGDQSNQDDGTTGEQLNQDDGTTGDQSNQDGGA